MFNSLSEGLTSVFAKLRKKGLLTEDDINTAMREIRIALLEADVALPVAKRFIQGVKEKALGQEVVKSVSPGQMVTKIVHDHLVELLGSDNTELNLNTTPPAVIMMVGLQGSGKTTSAAKIAKFLADKHHKKVLLASLDVYRPAAQQQLETLATQIAGHSLPIIEGQLPQDITTRALDTGRKEGFDVVILDTAGRLHIDNTLMQELDNVKSLASPIEILLTVDSLTGQDAVNIASSFHERLTVTGTVLTRIDGDGRGGVALSMRDVTGCPITFLGTGEKITDLEPFHPERIASRILDMGDVVSLVEKAIEQVDEDEAEALNKKLQKGTFDLDDLAKQLRQMRKMGGMQSILGLLPGMGGLKQKMSEANMDEKIFIHQEAIISSMTPNERRFPKLINASRKKRIAKGAGLSVQDVNKVLKQHKQMSTMVRKMSKMDKKTLMRNVGNMLPPGMNG